jgi:hypothetical protein
VADEGVFGQILGQDHQGGENGQNEYGVHYSCRERLAIWGWGMIVGFSAAGGVCPVVGGGAEVSLLFFGLE